MLEKNIKAKIEQKIGNVEQLPTLPDTYLTISTLLEDPETTAQDVSRIIEEDQAITVKTLKVVNSVLYGVPEDITTVTKAVVFLGFNGIRNIVYSISIINLFDEGPSKRKFDRNAFWKHAVATGTAARIIVESLKNKVVNNPEEAFTAGLVHDIGKIVEDQFMHEDFVKVLELSNLSQIPMIEAENKTFGFNHQHVGAYLAEKWELPEKLINVIRYHNSPDKNACDKRIFPLVAVVHIANAIARALRIGSGGDPFVPLLDQDCCDVLELTPKMIEGIIDKTQIAFEDIAPVLL